jgi:hypothetical protein
MINIQRIKDKQCVICLLDFTNAFGSCSVEAILRIMLDMGFMPEDVEIIQKIYQGAY